jgi:hypothetical protein
MNANSITQRDREAAEAVIEATGGWPDAIDRTAQAFAAHRLATIEECARVAAEKAESFEGSDQVALRVAKHACAQVATAIRNLTSQGE